MGIISTRTRTVIGGRAKLREHVAELSAAGTLLTYTDRGPDPDRLGCVRYELVLIVESDDPEPAPAAPTPAAPPRVISGEIVPVRPIVHPRTVPPRRLDRTRRTARAAYRRTRAVKRSTVNRTVTVTAWTALGGVTAWLAYEVVMAVIDVCRWATAHGTEIIGAVAALAVLLILAGAVRCSKCGR